MDIKKKISITTNSGQNIDITWDSYIEGKNKISLLPSSAKAGFKVKLNSAKNTKSFNFIIKKLN